MMFFKQILRISMILAALSLVTTFVYMPVGPRGHQYYGPDVPDIYILGGTILGKDMTFWGIAVASTAQLLAILYYIFSTHFAIRNIHKKSTVFVLMIINLGLLIVFPSWLAAYTEGVVCNSDGADLKILQPFKGKLLYVALLSFNILSMLLALKLLFKKRDHQLNTSNADI